MARGKRGPPPKKKTPIPRLDTGDGARTPSQELVDDLHPGRKRSGCSCCGRDPSACCWWRRTSRRALRRWAQHEDTEVLACSLGISRVILGELVLWELRRLHLRRVPGDAA